MPPAMPLLTSADGRGARPLLVTSAPDLLDDLLRLAAAADVTTTVATELGALRRAWAVAPLVVVGMDRAEACIAAGLPLRPHVVLVGGHVEDGRVWSAGPRIGADHAIFLPEAEPWLIDVFSDLDSLRRGSVTIGVVAGRRGSGASTLAVSLALSGLRHGLRTMLIDANPRGGGVAPGFARLLPAVGDPPPGGSDPRPTKPFPPPDGAPPGQLRGNVSTFRPELLTRGGDLTVVSWDLGLGPDVPVGPMATLLSTARSTSDLVVIDLPRQQDPAATLALDSCRTALVVLRADLASVMAAERVCTVVGRRCPDVQAVVRRRPSAGIAPAAISEMLGVPLAGVIADARQPAATAGTGAPRDAAARRPAAGPAGAPAVAEQPRGTGRPEHGAPDMGVKGRRGGAPPPTGQRPVAAWDTRPSRDAAGLRGSASATTESLSTETPSTGPLGAGPLDPFLADPHVTDVLVNAPDEVWVERQGRLTRTGVTFADEDAVRRLAVRLAAAAGRRLDSAVPFADVLLGDGTRMHAVLAPTTVRGTCLSLRRPRRRPFTFDELVLAGTLSPAVAAVLHALLHARLAVVVTGGTGTGKSTLLAALLGAVRPGERIVLVEDTAELAVSRPGLVRLEARPPNIEGAGEVTQRELVRQAMRMRPDRLVVGKVRGPEVLDLLVALNTGHEGGLSTVHANDTGALPTRLEALTSLAGLSRAAVHSHVAAALHAAVHLHRDADGQRKVRAVGVFRRAPDGLVQVVPALIAPPAAFRRADPRRGDGPVAAEGLPLLRSLLDVRGVRLPAFVGAAAPPGQRS